MDPIVKFDCCHDWLQASCYSLPTLEGSMSADSKLIPVTDATFGEQVLGSATPVLVKFEAEWCGPCKAMRPMVDDIASEYAGRLTVATVDIEQNNETVYRFAVRAVPTVLLFKNGEVFAQKVGLPRKADLVALIDKALEKAAA
jgi:thioredoxin 1